MVLASGFPVHKPSYSITPICHNMGGVDRGDQLRGYYSCRSKSRKFYKYIFYFLLDTTITNAYILSESPTFKKVRGMSPYIFYFGVTHVSIVACPHPLSCCIYAALIPCLDVYILYLFSYFLALSSLHPSTFNGNVFIPLYIIYIATIGRY